MNARRQLARDLRQRGYTISEIVADIGCARSSASLWTRDVVLNDEQRLLLRDRQKNVSDDARRRAAAHPSAPKAKWARIRAASEARGRAEIPPPNPQVLTVALAALFWGEGTRSVMCEFEICNTDPKMIRLIIFALETLGVPRAKIVARIRIHPSLNKNQARQYWSEVTGLADESFRIYESVSKATTQKRHTCPNGTLHLRICDSSLRARVEGWMNGLKNWVHESLASFNSFRANNSTGRVPGLHPGS